MQLTRFSMSLLIAVALHLVVLFWLLNNPINVQVDSDQQNSLSVTVDLKAAQKIQAVELEPTKPVEVKPEPVITTKSIETPKAVVPSAKNKKPVQAKKAKSEPKVEVVKEPKEVTPVVVQAALESKPTPELQQTSQAANNPLAEQKDRYLSALFQAIAKQQQYPRSAQRRGQEGRVLAGFSVQPDGQFIDVNITESSGYRVLDKAALQAVKRASGFAPLPEALLNAALSQAWAIQVPMEFRLNDD